MRLFVDAEPRLHLDCFSTSTAFQPQLYAHFNFSALALHALMALGPGSFVKWPRTFWTSGQGRGVTYSTVQGDQADQALCIAVTRT